MPKCYKCTNFFHPDFSLLIDQINGIYECVFCHTGKDTITIIDKQNGNEIEVKKHHAINQYIEYLKTMSQTKNVKSIIENGYVSRIIT